MESSIHKLVAILIFTVLIACQSSKFIAKPFLPEEKKVLLKEEGPAEFFYYDIKDAKYLWEFDIGAVADLYKYRDSLKMELGVHGLDLGDC